MARSDEKRKELASLLERDNPAVVAGAVEMLREEEPFEGAVGLLALCYDRNHGLMVDKAIESFMNDLKDKSLRAEVISEIKKDHSSRTLSMLISSCWQSGLDYSAFTLDFAEVFVRSDYGAALECLTVIEESIPVITDAEKNKIREYILDNTKNETGPKKALAQDLISMLVA